MNIFVVIFLSEEFPLLNLEDKFPLNAMIVRKSIFLLYSALLFVSCLFSHLREIPISQHQLKIFCVFLRASPVVANAIKCISMSHGFFSHVDLATNRALALTPISCQCSRKYSVALNWHQTCPTFPTESCEKQLTMRGKRSHAVRDFAIGLVDGYAKARFSSKKKGAYRSPL